MDIEVGILTKMLKDTNLEVANMDLKPKTIEDTQSLTASQFRIMMLEKIDSMKWGI